MSADQRSALAALEQARPIIARLGAAQGPEDRAADLIEGWSAVEAALRSLVGGSAATGPSLIREARARGAISFEAGNALAEFHSASERARRVDYAPNDADVGAARDAFERFERSLAMPSATAATTGGLGTPPPAVVPPVTASPRVDPVSVAAPSAARTDAAPALPAAAAPPRRPMPAWLKGLLGAAGLAALAALGWWAYQTSAARGGLDEAIALFERGQRQEAAAAFERHARENPNDARPHIYLSRLARQAGNLTLARDEAVKAVSADTGNARAHGELARVLMATGRWDEARRFWVRSLQIDPNDSSARGYLGCTFVRLGVYDQARRWLQLAGQGDWSVCAQQIPPVGAPYPPGAAPPAQYPPGIYPPGAPGQPYPQQPYPQQPYPQQPLPPTP